MYVLTLGILQAISVSNKDTILSALKKRFPGIDISINVSETSFIANPDKKYDRILVRIKGRGEFAVMNSHPMDIKQATEFIIDKINSPNTVYGK